jgi:putative GTP pyrophosphokinase
MLERNQLKGLFEANLPRYETALHSLYQTIRKLLEHQGFTPTIKYRIKRFEALHTKLRRLHSRRKGPQQGVTDLFGLRIICPFLEDIETVEKLLSDTFELAEVVRKGGQHSFREFGYDSVHLLIRLPGESPGELPAGVSPTCEIQLRTILQDAWAEVEHELVYKSDITLPNESIRRKLASLNATLTLSDLIFQEIRDYQKELRQLGDRRRASLANNLRLNDMISISLPVGETSPPPPSKKPAVQPLASRLEKTMLAALDAHSNHDYAGAIGLYDQLLGMRLKRPVRSLVYNHRGMARFALGQFRKSLKDFNQAIRFDPEYCRGYINRGLCHRVLQEFERSVADFTQALQIDPSRPEAWFGRAQASHDLLLDDRALADCEQALKLDSDYQPARDLQALIGKTRG